MPNYHVTFADTLEANTEDEAYDKFLGILAECVQYEDVVAFDFTEKPEDKLHKIITK